MVQANSSILALDVGSKRIGVAAASLAARLPSPNGVIDAGAADVFEQITKLAEDSRAAAIVVGYPRDMNGQVTDQTKAVEAFTGELKHNLKIPIYFQDEALTSVKAETELQSRGIGYSRGDVDSLAATYILEDWLNENKEFGLA